MIAWRLIFCGGAGVPLVVCVSRYSALLSAACPELRNEGVPVPFNWTPSYPTPPTLKNAVGEPAPVIASSPIVKPVAAAALQDRIESGLGMNVFTVNSPSGLKLGS